MRLKLFLPDNPVIPELVNNESQKSQDIRVEILPETGNPLVMVLLSLFALGLIRFRKKD